jgi:hypothetical protein
MTSMPRIFPPSIVNRSARNNRFEHDQEGETDGLRHHRFLFQVEGSTVLSLEVL